MDRKTRLKTIDTCPVAALLPSNAIAGENDKAIVQAVADYIRLSDAAFADGVSENETDRLAELGWKHAHKLPQLPSDSLTGIMEKVRWLRREENYNHGCFNPDYLNGKVLLSLFDDIERLA